MHEKFMRAHWEIEVFMLHHWAVDEMKCAWIEWKAKTKKFIKTWKIQISFSRKQQKKASAMNACLPLIARLLSSPIFCAVCYSPLLCVYSHRLSTATDCFISSLFILSSFIHLKLHALFLLSFISAFGRYSWFMNLKLKRERN